MALARVAENERGRPARSPRLVMVLVLALAAVAIVYAAVFGPGFTYLRVSDSGVAAQLLRLEKKLSDAAFLERQVKEAVEKLQASQEKGREEAASQLADLLGRRLREDTGAALAAALDPQGNSSLRSLIESAASRSSSQPEASELAKKCQAAGGSVGSACACNCTGAAPEDRSWGEGEEPPLCLDGGSPGRWRNYSTWEASNCRYRDFTVAEVRRCLKGKWVHFYGDSLSRLLANTFSNMAGMNRRDWSWDKDRSMLMDTAADEAQAQTSKGGGGKAEAGTETGAATAAGRRRLLGGAGDWGVEAGGGRPAGALSGLAPRRGQRTLLEATKGSRRSARRDERPRVTYLFRAKMAHQRHPGANSTGESDLNNHFLEALREKGAAQPDYLVLSIGAHEVIGWSGRPAVDLDLELFKADTEEFLQMLRKSFTHEQLIWWKANYIWPGKVAGKDFFLVQQYHEQYQEYAYRRFKEEGYLVADFYQTTATRPDLLYSKDGVHYGGLAMKTHTKILLNMMCNPRPVGGR